MHESSVTIFPSITPAATASIVTGAYPSETGIAGAAWYDQAAEQIVYYGDDFWVVVREGFRNFLEDFLVRLNGDRLKAATLFELVEQSGRTAASLNYLVHKGLLDYKVHVPMLLAMLGYWAFGLPIAYVLGFVVQWRGQGIWFGLAAGLGFVAVVLVTRFALRERLGLLRTAPT